MASRHYLVACYDGRDITELYRGTDSERVEQLAKQRGVIAMSFGHDGEKPTDITRLLSTIPSEAEIKEAMSLAKAKIIRTETLSGKDRAVQKD